jgi:hypothetical protein
MKRPLSFIQRINCRKNKKTVCTNIKDIESKLVIFHEQANQRISGEMEQTTAMIDIERNQRDLAILKERQLLYEILSKERELVSIDERKNCIERVFNVGTDVNGLRRYSRKPETFSALMFGFHYIKNRKY